MSKQVILKDPENGFPFVPHIPELSLQPDRLRLSNLLIDLCLELVADTHDRAIRQCRLVSGYFSQWQDGRAVKAQSLKNVVEDFGKTQVDRSIVKSVSADLSGCTAATQLIIGFKELHPQTLPGEQAACG